MDETTTGETTTGETPMDETTKQETLLIQAPTGRRWAGGMARGSTRSAPSQGGGAVYGLGMIGALVYFVGRADSGTDYALAVAKAVVWPAILVYLAFKKLGG
jgi:hypothetical protein